MRLGDYMGTATGVHGRHAPARSITILNATFRLAWITVVAITVMAEVMPAHFAPAVFYSYKVAKGFLFLTLGYLTPLTFWRFHSLNRAFLFAAASASAVELLQKFIGNGHSFSFVELLAKLAVIAFGFLLALDACYEREIRVGPLRVRLVSEHLPDR